MIVGAAIGVAILAVWFVAAGMRKARIETGASEGGSEHEALAEFGERALELDSVELILDLAAETARQVFGARSAVSFVHGIQEGTWDARTPGTAEGDPVPAALRGVFGWFRHNTAIAVRSDLSQARFGAMRGPLAQIMDRYQVDVIAPLVHRERIVAAFALQLGRRPSGLDRALMRKFRLETTAACANVRLHREASHIISLAREVDLASAAQQALVPDEFDGHAASLQWAGHYRAASEAGSDFWSAYPLGNRVLVIIGDATGIGLAGSMVSAVVKSCCDAIIDAHGDHVDPAALLGTLNRALWRPEKPAHMTAFAALFDVHRGLVKYANAGHCFPYHVGVSGRLGVLKGSGPVLGDELQSRYTIHEHALAQGDTVLFYTDGVTAAQNPAGAAFGERRLQKLLANAQTLPAGALRDRIIGEVDRFREQRSRPDDEALVVVRVGARSAG